MQTTAQLSGLMFGISGLVYLAVLIGGFYAAMTRRKRHPKVSLLVFVALGIMLAALLADVLFPPLAIYLASQLGQGFDEMNWLLVARGLVSTLARAAALVILLVAVFGWRNEAAVQYGEASGNNANHPSYADADLSE